MKGLAYYLTALALGIAVNASAKEPRKLHYEPWQDVGARCVDGSTRFNRALYGAHSGFRMECSDMTEFGVYLPRMGGNLLLSLPEGECEAIYVPGKMIYNQGGVQVCAEVLRSEDAALWSLTNKSGVSVTVPVRYGGVAEKRFSREGDLGVDPPDCFDLKPEYCKGNVFEISADTVWVEYGAKARKKLALVLPLDAGSAHVTELPTLEGAITLDPNETKRIALFPPASMHLMAESLPDLMVRAEQERQQLTNGMAISTPDPWINPIGGAMAAAADGIWSGEAWLHGSIGWRTPYAGWRGAYVGDAIGWHDRARTHFDTYADNQITDVPAVYPHPRQDEKLNLARAEKKWGTPMYSTGYICRTPGKKDEMSHYDMNLVYIDALMRHLRHTGDTAAMRRFFPVIKRHLDWENLNYDPDGDGLYDAYCCIWASDALYYSGGDVTHSSAYNYFANQLAGEVAEAIGEDAAPFYAKADKIKQAIADNLWMPERGHWAEHRDRMHQRRLHPSAALWTIYHAIDSEIADPLQAYAATTYVDREIPFVPVEIEGETTDYAVPSTTNWKPYSWSINNVAIAEIMHTALAYWQTGRADDAFKLMKSVVMDNMYLGASPLNFGQISYYDAARGECYRDFADPIGVWSRALVEGLYGIRPNLLSTDKYVEVRPGFPKDWAEASITISDIGYDFARQDGTDIYNVQNRYGDDVSLRLNVRVKALPASVKVNGKEAAWHAAEYAVNEPSIVIDCGPGEEMVVEIAYGESLAGSPTGQRRIEGPVTFSEMQQGSLRWWVAEVDDSKLRKTIPADGFDDVKAHKCQTVDLGQHYNASVADIFNNEYLSPRPDVTTLQIPKQGIGEWCHPSITAEIDDTGLRNALKQSHNELAMDNGIKFAMPAEGNNVIYTSLWDNYPDQAAVPLSGRAKHAYLVLAGSTNHMESGMANGRVKVVYADGSADTLELVNPYNWAPIEQDFYNDEHAFALPEGREPILRMHLASGRVSRHLGEELGDTRIDGRRIPGGAAVVLDMPLNPKKKLSRLEIETLSGDVVIGLMAVTLQKP